MWGTSWVFIFWQKQDSDSAIKSFKEAGSVSVRVQKEDVYIFIYNFGRSTLLAAVTPKYLDVFDIFYRRKNIRLGINGNPGGEVGGQLGV